jgi:hypothetical protein
MSRIFLVVAGSLAMASPAGAVDIVVNSGSERMLGRFGSVNELTCQATSKTPIITQPPARGHADVRAQTFRVANKNLHCLGQSYRGFGIYYRAQAGFRGADTIVVSTFLSNGRVDVRTDTVYNIIVK